MLKVQQLAGFGKHVLFACLCQFIPVASNTSLDSACAKRCEVQAFKCTLSFQSMHSVHLALHISMICSIVNSRVGTTCVAQERHIRCMAGML